MTILDNIQKTINDIFDLYRNASRKFYGLSLSGGILASFFSTFISGIICFIMLNFIDLTSLGFEPSSIFESFVFNPIIMDRFQSITQSILILIFGLYATFLIQEEKKGFEDKYKLKDFIQGVPKKIWNQFYFLLGILLLINAVFFIDIFKLNYQNSGMLDLAEIFSNYEPNDVKFKFFNWVNSIIILIKQFLPYILAMVLVMYSYNIKVNMGNLKKYKIALITSLILCFSIETLSYTLLDYIDFYIINLVRVPFENSILPGIVSLFLKLAIGVFFYLGFAATIAYPFKQIKNSHPKEG